MNQMTEFSKLGLSNDVVVTLERLGIKKPTEIQEKSIPHILKGEDLIGESATGSGKTLAFGSGIIEKVQPGKGFQALILTPTRELAHQIKGAMKEFSPKNRLNIITIYGGVAIGPQIDGLKKADVVVATPGRYLDHLQRNTINNSKIKILILDEADRMFDMGFMEDVEKIIRSCPKQRQTLFFSATISPKIKKLGSKYMVNPKCVSARKHVDATKLSQFYYEVPRNLKLSLLLNLFDQEKSGLSMIFCNTRRNADFVTQNLKSNRVKAMSIHGGLSQNKRTKTIKMFNDGRDGGILVCTDVAARGLHIDNVSHIYNYDLPNDPTDYVHRIGRTARAGEYGKVINLLSKFDYDNFSRILAQNRSFSVKKLEKPYLQRLDIVKSEPRPRPSGKRPFHQGKRFGSGGGNNGNYNRRRR